jgi:hypothetical protein
VSRGGARIALALALALALLAAAAVPARPAHADPPDPATRKARAHFDKGKELFGEGEFEAAIHEFEAAERIKPAPANHYNMAQAYEKLGDLPSAISSYTLYLDGLPDAHDREVIEGKISTLEALLRATPTVGYVRIDLAEAGTEVLVDGEARGKTPLTTVLELEAGKHVVRLQKRGFIAWEGTITVIAGGSTVVAAALVSEGEEPGRRRTGAWVVSGLAAGALLVGVSLGGGALAANGGFVHDGPRSAVAMRLALAADVAFAGGGALAVTAIVVWIAGSIGGGSGSGSGSGGPRAAVVPLVAPGVAGAVVAGRF